MLVVSFTNPNTSSGSLTFTPPLVEKMKVELAIQDWEQAEDTANRVSTFIEKERNFFLSYEKLIIQSLTVFSHHILLFSGLSDRT